MTKLCAMHSAYDVTSSAKMEKVKVSGLEELLHAVGQRTGSGKNIYILFCGDVSPQTNESWCSDCVKAMPVIEKVLNDLQSGVFIHCSVGDRDTWKNPENVFRVHPKLNLKGVPTLLQWDTPKKLGDEECSREELVRMLFEEDLD